MYAKIIVDISHEKLDKGFLYKIPAELVEKIKPGMQVKVPFGKGNREICGYVIELKEQADFDPDKIKNITGIVKNAVPIESKLIELAWFIKEQYGSSMNQALKTVIPIKTATKDKKKRTVILCADETRVNTFKVQFEKRHATARLKLLETLCSCKSLDYEYITKKLSISPSVINAFEVLGLVEINEEKLYRNPIDYNNLIPYDIKLNKEQQRVTDSIWQYMVNAKESGGQVHPGVHLINGITGSGKTEVYMELIDRVINTGRQVIVLIPEISLTYQTVMRFYRRFKDKVGVINSRLSDGEKYDQFERAKNGETRIMIGPRSAVFTPFDNLGLIIIDEEHEGAYKSEQVPKYHAREVAIFRANNENAAVVLGSATPSVESYYKALRGEYLLHELTARALNRQMADVHVVDLREELKAGNKSVISRKLDMLIRDRLEKKQQIMLFINRRGYAGFVSCRNCGEAVKCPHCDVGLKYHNSGKLVCHYCGYEIPMMKKCPKCGSKYIAAFGTGTQKIEEVVKKMYPQARTLRMDMDTTGKKNSHREILEAFSQKKADILVGTQMIVKGHDFPDVTLVGVIAADLSLYSSDYKASERTFQLLTQAAGRAGRGKLPGEVVIQTYSPDNYSIEMAAKQDYKEFYNREILYRNLCDYPPVVQMMAVLITGKVKEKTDKASDDISKCINDYIKEKDIKKIHITGPVDAVVSKINDIYRRVIYIKHSDMKILISIKDCIEKIRDEDSDTNNRNREVTVSFDINPMNGY